MQEKLEKDYLLLFWYQLLLAGFNVFIEAIWK